MTFYEACYCEFSFHAVSFIWCFGFSHKAKFAAGKYQANPANLESQVESQGVSKGEGKREKLMPPHTTKSNEVVAAVRAVVVTGGAVVKRGGVHPRAAPDHTEGARGRTGGIAARGLPV